MGTSPDPRGNPGRSEKLGIEAEDKADVDAKLMLLLVLRKDLCLDFWFGSAMGTRLGMQTAWLPLALMPSTLRLVLAPRVTVG